MEPALDRAESRSPWSDAPARASLRVVAESVALLSGFRHAVINVRRDDLLEVVATSSPELEHLLGTTMAVEVLERELTKADEWGDLRFVPHERVGDEVLSYSYVPDLEPTEGPGAWHPMDLLAAPIYDGDGTLRGLLTVDVPVDGLRPNSAQRNVLERYAGVTRTTVLIALQREELEQRVRLMTEVRELVRRALGESSLELVIEACRSALVQSFGAEGMLLSVSDGEGSLSSTWYSESGLDRPNVEELGDLGSVFAQRYWADQYVADFSRTRDVHPGLDAADAKQVIAFLDEIGIGSMLFIPLGAGTECLGYLALARACDEPAWTDREHDAALDIGHDLGRAVANVRQLEKERALVTGLRELDGYRTELINTVAHELRSPLTAVMGNLEMTDFEEDLSDAGRRSVAAALRGARRIETVIDDLLTVARFSDPRAPFEPVDVDLCSVVLDVVEECGHAATARSIRVTTEMPEGPVLVRGGHDELHRALANVVGNAIKYSEDGSPVVVRLEQGERDVLLSVADQGLGISERDQASLFREFHRSSNPEALNRPGTGLGLVIVQRIVRRHGGEVRVDSQLGHGTTVTLSLRSTLEE